MTVIVLLLTHLTYGFNYVFTTLPKDYGPISVSSEIKNLPSLRSQDSIGDCHATSAGFLIDEFNCRKNKVKDCSQVGDEQRASRLDLTRFSITPTDDANQPSSYKSIKPGGWIQSDLDIAMNKLKSVAKESCAPLNIFASNEKEIMSQETKAKIAKVQQLYRENVGETPFDLQCASEEIKKLFPQANDIKKMTSAMTEYSGQQYLSSSTFNNQLLSELQFLYETFYPDKCNLPENRIEMTGQPQSWPPFSNPEKTYTNEEYESKIAELLSAGYPIGVDGICLQDIETTKVNPDDCENGMPLEKKVGKHSFVITGLGKKCTPQGECRHLVKVANTWGEDWQKMNDDGWVDLRNIVLRLPKKISKSSQASVFSWIK